MHLKPYIFQFSHIENEHCISTLASFSSQWEPALHSISARASFCYQWERRVKTENNDVTDTRGMLNLILCLSDNCSSKR